MVIYRIHLGKVNFSFFKCWLEMSTKTFLLVFQSGL